MTDAFTLTLELSPWAIRLVWELVLLWRRRKAPRPNTISMTMRDFRFRLTSHIYLASGMLVHWFVPWRHATVSGAIAFWLVAVGLFVWDLVLWSRPVETWSTALIVSRDPPLWLLAGALAGLVLFPQGV